MYIGAFIVHIAQLIIIVRLNREIFFLQPPVDNTLDDIVDHCKGGHTHEHSRESEQSTSQKDGENNPESGKPCTVAKDLRSNEIAVQLLQKKDKDNKIHTLQRICEHDQEGRWDRSYVGAEKRDHIGHAHDHADQHHIRHLE